MSILLEKMSFTGDWRVGPLRTRQSSFQITVQDQEGGWDRGREPCRPHGGRRSRVLWPQDALARHRAPVVWLGLQRSKVPPTTGRAEATLHTDCGDGSVTGKGLDLPMWPGLMLQKWVIPEYHETSPLPTRRISLLLGNWWGKTLCQTKYRTSG